MPTIKKKVSPLKRLILNSEFERLPNIEKGFEYHCLSVGQYNLIDIVEHVADQIGECSVDLAVWTAANASLKRAENFVKYGKIKNMRWIIDPSFQARQPSYVRTLNGAFGRNCIRTIPTHAKFIVMYNDNWSVLIQTSMNLNQNKRLESFTIIEDEKLCSFYKDFTSLVFSDIDQELNFESQNNKALKTLIEKKNYELNPDIQLEELPEMLF